MRKFIIALLLLITFLPMQAIPQSIVMRRGITSATNYEILAVGAWRMNGDGSDSEIDRSGNGNDLTVSAGDTIPRSTTVPPGFSGYSRTWATADADYLTIADGTELDINGASAEISIVAFIDVTTVPSSGTTRELVSKYGSSSQNQYQLQIVGTGASHYKTRFSVSGYEDGTNSTEVFSTTTTLAGNTYYCIGAVLNDSSNEISLFTNGVLDSTPVSHTTGIYNGTGPFRIGLRGDGAVSPIDGLKSSVAVFNFALTPAQMQEICTNGFTGNKDGND
jgi:hypothetical protein